MSAMTLFILDLLFLITLLFIGLPLPMCFGGAVAFMTIFADIGLKGLFLWVFNQMTSITLIAGPLFIFAGTLICEGGIADRLLDLFSALVGKVKASLGIVSTLCCGFLGAISGSAFTGVAAIGPALHPRMVKAGYPKGYAASLISAGSVLGQLIPPSSCMIVYGWVTGTSVLACFLATIGPALVVITLFCIINIIDCRRFPDGPSEVLTNKVESKVNSAMTELDDEAADMIGKFKANDVSAMSKKEVFIKAIPGLMMPVIILGGIYGGIFSPSEAAAVSASVAIIIGFFIYKKLNGKNVLDLIKRGSTTVGSIMTMILFCLTLSQTFVLLKIPQQLVEIFMSFTDNRYIVLLIVNVFLFFIGMIVNDSTTVVLCAPILVPLVGAYGISPIQMAGIMCTTMAMGALTPPYASVLYLGMRVCDCSFEEMIGPMIKFVLLVFVPTALLTTFWPPLSEFLPRVMGYI